MKTLFKTLITLLIFSLSYLLSSVSIFPVHSMAVIKQTTDSRGLTSIIYTSGGDTMAYDYLSKEEMAEIIK